MATLAGKTDRYRPNDPSWQPASYYGGFMPNIVPDQQMAMKASQFPPQSVIDSTFASLPTWASPEPGMQPGIPQGDMVPPAGSQYASATPIPQTGSSVLSMLPTAQPTPAVAAASSLANPAVTNVQGTMLPRRSGGGFLEMLMGPSKNGMDGLPGLLGGPGAGGILGMLGGSDGAVPRSLPRKSTVNHKASRDAAERSGQTVSGTPSKHGRYYNSDTNTWM